MASRYVFGGYFGGCFGRCLETVKVGRSLSKLALGLVMVSGCSKKAPASLDPNAAGFDRVPFTQTVKDGDLEAARIVDEEPATQNFLLTLNKNTWLDRRIFVSVGVERASLTGLAMSVIGYIPARLKLEGDQLILLRDNQGLFGGNTLAPEMPINSYKVLQDRGGEILVDLSQAQSSYGISALGQSFAQDAATDVQARIEYLKQAQVNANGLHYKSVVVAQSTDPLFEEDETAESMTGQDPYLVSMVLRVDWVLDATSPNFSPLPASEFGRGLFLDRPLLDRTGTNVTRFVNRININKNHIWQLSANTPVEFRESVQAGVTIWNRSFDRNVLETTVAASDGDLTNPAVNNLVWDDNLLVGFAFANWRSNPYTGEILQAQVYMSGDMWRQAAELSYRLRQIESVIELPEDAPSEDQSPEEPPLPDLGPEVGPDQPIGGGVHALKDALRGHHAAGLAETLSDQPKRPRLFFGLNRAMALEAVKQNNFCYRGVPDARTPALRQLRAAQQFTNKQKEPTTQFIPFDGNTQPIPAATMEEFSQQVVRAVVLHEVGHAIGLRHNFAASGYKTSDAITSGSIMDYNDLVVDAQFDRPGLWDHHVIRAAYYADEMPDGLKFCTDEDLSRNLSACRMGDWGQDPASSYLIAARQNLKLAKYFVDAELAPLAIRQIGRSINNLGWILDELYGASRSKQQAQETRFAAAIEAWHASVDELAPPPLRATIDELGRLEFLKRLAQRGAQDASQAAGWSQTRLSEVILNEGLAFKTRHTAVGVLQGMQTKSAYEVYLATLEGLKTKDNWESKELARRMERVLQEGFLKP